MTHLEKNREAGVILQIAEKVNCAVFSVCVVTGWPDLVVIYYIHDTLYIIYSIYCILY